MGEPRLIKKYPNRRLYDPTLGRYIDLSVVEKIVESAIDLRVIDKLTGRDITCSVLLQIIAAREHLGERLLTQEFLKQLIRCQERGPRSLTASYLDNTLKVLESEPRR